VYTGLGSSVYTHGGYTSTLALTRGTLAGPLGLSGHPWTMEYPSPPSPPGSNSPFMCDLSNMTAAWAGTGCFPCPPVLGENLGPKYCVVLEVLYYPSTSGLKYQTSISALTGCVSRQTRRLHLERSSMWRYDTLCNVAERCTSGSTWAKYPHIEGNTII